MKTLKSTYAKKKSIDLGVKNGQVFKSWVLPRASFVSSGKEWSCGFYSRVW